MKIKLNKSELHEFKIILENEVPVSTNFQQIMKGALLVEVYTKIHTKALFPKDKTAITLSLAQAVALLLHFGSINSDNDYQNNLIRIWIAQIHKYITNLNLLKTQNNNEKLIG